MKKFLTLITFSCLFFGLAATALAETTLYLDVWGNGNFQNEYTENYWTYQNGSLLNTDFEKDKTDEDLSGYTLGFESTFNKFKVGMEYGMNNSELYGEEDGVKYKVKYDFTLAEVKGGYRVVDKERFKLDLTMAVIDLNTEVSFSDDNNKGIINFGGNMLGTDFNIIFSEKASLQGTLATSLLGANVSDYEKDPQITEFKLKFNYFITDNWALALGYRLYEFSASSGDIDYNDDGMGTIYKYIEKNDIEGSISGLTLGAVYKF